MAEELVFIKPIEGATVRYPDSMTMLSADGALVALTTYWRRRVNDGSVTVVAESSPNATTVSKEENDFITQSAGRTRGGK